ncbi:hypothetical protein PILCRDRAFT_201325 [Piloderma croceum F 1598]|uniref:Uncharacterized protein n=1 Tax=Piloderma croceum (strain F 1598) TaxID=765440 RepID=A0A0C3G113_PILCF|nr:hypothetical protein PILCRDRAFT_201325 [Piloderma croceum F 1598]
MWRLSEQPISFEGMPGSRAWPELKASCQSWQKAFREAANVPLSTHDRHFFHFVGSTDVFLSAHRIKAEIKQFYPSAPLSSLLLCMYYITTPPTFKVSLLSSETWDNDDEREEMEGFRRLSKEAEGRRLLVQICIRDGYSVTGGPKYHAHIPLDSAYSRKLARRIGPAKGEC